MKVLGPAARSGSTRLTSRGQGRLSYALSGLRGFLLCSAFAVCGFGAGLLVWGVQVQEDFNSWIELHERAHNYAWEHVRNAESASTAEAKLVGVPRPDRLEWRVVADGTTHERDPRFLDSQSFRAKFLAETGATSPGFHSATVIRSLLSSTTRLATKSVAEGGRFRLISFTNVEGFRRAQRESLTRVLWLVVLATWLPWLLLNLGSGLREPVERVLARYRDRIAARRRDRLLRRLKGPTPPAPAPRAYVALPPLPKKKVVLPPPPRTQPPRPRAPDALAMRQKMRNGLQPAAPTPPPPAPPPRALVVDRSRFLAPDRDWEAEAEVVSPESVI